jgi:hypothetical protein
MAEPMDIDMAFPPVIKEALVISVYPVQFIELVNVLR